MLQFWVSVGFDFRISVFMITMVIVRNHAIMKHVTDIQRKSRLFIGK